MSTTDIAETTVEQDSRTAYADGLRQVADWIEANPDVPLPGKIRTYLSYNRETAVQQLAAVARALPRAEKSADDLYFKLAGQFGGVEMVFSASRSAVCEKQTVVKEVEEWVCPDSLLEYAAAASGEVSP